MDALGTGIQPDHSGASSNVCQFKHPGHRGLCLSSPWSCRGGFARQPAVFRTMEFAHTEFGQCLFEPPAQIIRWPNPLERLSGLGSVKGQNLYEELCELTVKTHSSQDSQRRAGILQLFQGIVIKTLKNNNKINVLI